LRLLRNFYHYNTFSKTNYCKFQTIPVSQFGLRSNLRFTSGGLVSRFWPRLSQASPLHSSSVLHLPNDSHSPQFVVDCQASILGFSPTRLSLYNKYPLSHARKAVLEVCFPGSVAKTHAQESN